jgi:hypothetical protein
MITWAVFNLQAHSEFYSLIMVPVVVAAVVGWSSHVACFRWHSLAWAAMDTWFLIVHSQVWANDWVVKCTTLNHVRFWVWTQVEKCVFLAIVNYIRDITGWLLESMWSLLGIPALVLKDFNGVSSVNCFHNIYHRGSRFTQLPMYSFSVVQLARGAVASFDWYPVCISTFW